MGGATPLMSTRAPYLAATWLALAFAAGGASAHHRSSAGDSVPGEFAYYLLSLSWSPQFCLSSPQDAQCAGPRRYGFIVHGLWPQNERGWPEHCAVHSAVPDETVQSLADIMPARGLIYHEWSAHGTCSGLDPEGYFALLRRAYASIVIPQEFSAPSQAIQQSPDAVAQAFVHANARLGTGSVVVICSGQETPRLREVHICLDRDLKPRSCSHDAMRGACTAEQLIIAPIR
jgi:ribonuclease T2